MSKRKLTKRQAWRINKIQQEKSARAAKREANDLESLPDSALGPEQLGLVIAHYGTFVEVEALETEALETKDDVNKTSERQRCHFRTNLGSLVTGDRVSWRKGEPYGVVVAVEPRRSELSRPDPYGDLKTIAANIDHIFVVIAPIPKAHTQLIDRYLVAAEAQHIKPILIINKSDLIGEEHTSEIDLFTSLYQSLGYQVLKVSTKTNSKPALEKLERLLVNRTSVFVGQSGVGKSSLINALIPDLNLQTGAISEANQKGTHTTTTAQLFHFPKGGHLIDSPGIREFGLWHMDEQDILEGFIEIRPFAANCKFRDCRHQQEPGCAIEHAVAEGKISDYRIASFKALRDELRDK
jgi:ribosome biogenesis GTPase